MKARPILFSGRMIQALRGGRKTQTRRVVTLRGHDGVQALHHPWRYLHEESMSGNQLARHSQGVHLWQHRTDITRMIEERCPYGQPGDLLWVREMHAIVPRTAYAMSDGVQQTLRPDDNHDAAIYREGWDRSPPGRWRPSIHMHRWASRLTLRLTDVRVERLQEISEADAIAEGIENVGGTMSVAPWKDYAGLSRFSAPSRSFHSLWESLHGPGAWERNDWVWALTFDVIHANVDQVLKEAAAARQCGGDQSSVAACEARGDTAFPGKP